MTDDPKCCGNCRFHGEVPYGQGGITCQRHAPAAAGPRIENGVPRSEATWPQVGYSSLCGDYEPLNHFSSEPKP